MEKIDFRLEPGTNCLYFKLYGGPVTLDDILLKRIRPFFNQLIQQSKIEHWFFVRYRDKYPHLRIRIFSHEPHQTLELLKDLINPYFDSGMIWDIRLDTYHREIYRYKQVFFPNIEKLFYYDSTCIVDILAQNKMEYTDTIAIAMANVEQFANILCIEHENRLVIYKNLAQRFMTRFMFDKKQRNQLTKVYRENINDWTKKDIIRPSIAALFIKRFNQIETEKWSYILGTNSIQESMTIFPDIIHMSLNRLFRTNQLINEMVVYDALAYYYKSILYERD